LAIPQYEEVMQKHNTIIAQVRSCICPLKQLPAQYSGVIDFRNYENCPIDMRKEHIDAMAKWVLQRFNVQQVYENMYKTDYFGWVRANISYARNKNMTDNQHWYPNPKDDIFMQMQHMATRWVSYTPEMDQYALVASQHFKAMYPTQANVLSSTAIKMANPSPYFNIVLDKMRYGQIEAKPFCFLDAYTSFQNMCRLAADFGFLIDQANLVIPNMQSLPNQISISLATSRLRQ
jgi:hypothetical protein